MPGPHDEHTFETALVHEMTTISGWTERPVTDFDRDLLLIPDDLQRFLAATQPEVIEQLQQRLGHSWLRQTCEIISHGLKKPGDTLTLLRKGKVVSGVSVKLAFYKPTHEKNPETVARYEANRLTVMRQVPYSRAHGNTLDVVMFVNGLPVADAELKNGTGQVTDDAVDQYQTERDAREPFFHTRSVVHFAADPNTVMMSTTVGDEARFLPFNRGSSRHGLASAGNYQPADGSQPTSYLWRDVWQRDAWMDLIQSFIHLQPADPEDRTSTPTLIFPRYHQWDCVLQYVARARDHGSGLNELAMHSTGSGKTMTQAWLAHRLANLFGDDGEKVFDKVVVLTDRRVLDRNMQWQIEQFEPDAAHGIVESITGTSQDLRVALESKTAKIIVTTIQKFPYIVRDVSTVGQRFAVIIDEAHSSQSGESAQAMQQALTTVEAGDEQALLKTVAEVAAVYEPGEDDDPAGEMAALVASSRRRQDTISMFAFTATPKAKTLNQFGQLDGEGVRRPTHVYSMRQAIDEKFIMNMLASYTTYKTYWRIAARDGSTLTSEEVDKSKAMVAVRRFAMLDLHNISQKVQIIVEHFRQHVQHRINRRAKAMIVTASRLHAVRYKKELDAYITDQGYNDLHTLVAFADQIIDPDSPGEPFTESSMNDFPDTQTEGRFATDDYQVMVVAEKYQTGYSQPLIHTIYVDKKLTGLTAVQTLSRGNRIHKHKHDTFVLDFINDVATIEQAYSQYMGEASAPDVDPQVMYETWEAVDEYGVIAQADVEGFAAAWFDPAFDPSRDDAKQKTRAAEASAAINRALGSAIGRLKALDEDGQEGFRRLLRSWVGQYALLSQMVTWSDAAWEERYQYSRLLSSRITRTNGKSLDISDELQMTHYKMDKTFNGAIEPEPGTQLPPAFGPGGESVMTRDEQLTLLEVLDQINERYGLGLDDRHLLFVEQAGISMTDEGDVQRSAGNNSAERFIKEVFVDRLISSIMLTADENFDFAEQVVNKPEIARLIEGPLGRFVWRVAREKYETAQRGAFSD